MLCLPPHNCVVSSSSGMTPPIGVAIRVPMPSYAYPQRDMSSIRRQNKTGKDSSGSSFLLDTSQSLEGTGGAIASSQHHLRFCTAASSSGGGTPSPAHSGNSDSGHSSGSIGALAAGGVAPASLLSSSSCSLRNVAPDLSTIMTEPYADSQSNTKSLIHSSFPGHYYNTAMYGQAGANLPYTAAVQPSAVTHNSLYGAGSQSYYAATRALKGGGSNYSLGSYFGATAPGGGNTTPPAYYSAYPTAGDYGGGGGGAAGGYGAMAAAGYPSMYGYHPYSHAAAANSSVAAAAAATYHLTQLPPSTSTAAEESLAAATAAAAHSFVKVEKKSKGKKKKQTVPSPSPDVQFERVFVWELEDVCLMSAALISGAYASKYQKDATSAVTVGYRMEELVCLLASNSFSSTDLDDCDQVHIDDVSIDEPPQPPPQELSLYGFASGADVSGLMQQHHGGGGMFHHAQLQQQQVVQQQQQQPQSAHMACLAGAGTNGAQAGGGGGVRGGVDWMRKLAYRYKQIRDLYTAYKDAPGELLTAAVGGNGGQPAVDKWTQIKADYDQATDNWTPLAARSLTLVNTKCRYANVIVTQYPLVQTLAKLIVYGLSPSVPIENVYSFSKVGRDACFERISNRFGKKCTFVAVGCSSEHETIAKQNQIPFWRITDHSALQALYSALEMDHL